MGLNLKTGAEHRQDFAIGNQRILFISKFNEFYISFSYHSLNFIRSLAEPDMAWGFLGKSERETAAYMRYVRCEASF